MAAKIERALPGTPVDLIKGRGGNFIVKADGKVLWDKRAMDDQFPDDDDVVDDLRGSTG